MIQTYRHKMFALMFLYALYVSFSLAGLHNCANATAALVTLSGSVFLFQTARRASSFSFIWYSLSAALFAWFIGDLVWTIVGCASSDPQNVIALYYVYILPGLCILSALVYLSVRGRRQWARLQFLADILAIFMSVLGFAYFFFFPDHFLLLISFDPLQISSFVYLVTDLLIITLALTVYLSLKPFAIPRYVLASFLGLILFTGGDLLYIYILLGGQYVPNSLSDILSLAGLTAIASGGILYTVRPVPFFSTDRDTVSFRAVINRSIILIAIPLIAIALKPGRIEQVGYFAIIILLHQLLTHFFRGLIVRDMEISQHERQKTLLEAVIQERTRELRVMNQTLENLIKRDAITSLFNRKYFMEYTEEAIETAGDDDRVWMLLLDFDRFKSINDLYGHDVGDQILRVIGRRLDGLSGEQTVVARLGGDEFGVVAFRPKEESISRLIQNVLKQYDEPVRIGAFSIHVSVSIGVSVWPDDASTRSDLMRHADIALFVAKKSHFSSTAFFDRATNVIIARKNQIDLGLKKADIATEFCLVYQPQFSAGSNRLVGMEALVRWDSPEMGIVPPDEFIPIAEENGFILPLSEWIFRNAMQKIAEWNTAWGKNLVMGINVSPIHLEDGNFLSTFNAMLAEYRVDPSWLNLEITERFAMTEDAYIVTLFDRLGEMGVKTSIDDFGTGYSSLSYLKRYSIDYLKIAKQLIDGVSTNDTDFQLVQAIISMATVLSLRTIAEGVENEAQYRALEKLGCDEIQGYYFGRPIDGDEFEELHLKE